MQHRGVRAWHKRLLARPCLIFKCLTLAVAPPPLPILFPAAATSPQPGVPCPLGDLCVLRALDADGDGAFGPGEVGAFVRACVAREAQARRRGASPGAAAEERRVRGGCARQVADALAAAGAEAEAEARRGGSRAHTHGAAREFGKWAARLLATDEQASFVRREAERGQEQGQARARARAQGQASDGEEGAVVEGEHDEHEHEDNAASLLLPPPAGYVGRGAAEALYALLGAAQDGAAPAKNQQAFFDLLQRAGEEAGLLDLEDETLDECVPLAVVEEAVASHAEAFAEDLAGVLQ